MIYLESVVSWLDFKTFIMCPASATRTLNFSPVLWVKERLNLAARDKPLDDQSHSKWWMPWLSSHRRCEIVWLLLWLCVQTKCIYLPTSYVLFVCSPLCCSLFSYRGLITPLTWYITVCVCLLCRTHGQKQSNQCKESREWHKLQRLCKLSLIAFTRVTTCVI